MTMKQDGAEVFILPDRVVCEITDKNPLDMDECPYGLEVCTGDCFYYIERWEGRM